MASVLALAGCQYGSDPAPIQSAILEIRLDRPDSGLTVQVNDHSVILPASLSEPKGERLTFLLTSPQYFDNRPEIPGPDMRYILAWDSGDGGSGFRSLTTGRNGTLSIRTRKEYKCVFEGPHGAFPFEDSALWLPADTGIELAAPSLPGLDFEGWSLSGLNVAKGGLSFRIDGPKVVSAWFRQIHRLAFRSYPDTTLFVGPEEAPAPAPWERVVLGTEEASIFAPPLQERDASGSVPGADVRFRFDHWREDSATENPARIKLGPSTVRTAVFREEVKVSVAADPPEAAKVPPELWLAPGARLHLKPPPSRTFAFSHWLLNGQRLEASDTLDIPIDSPAVATAVYSLPIPAEKIQALADSWRSVLGDAGPATADRLISKVTGGCVEYGSGAAVAAAGADLRKTLVASLGLDFSRRIRSAQVQKRFRADGYSIDVVRLEVFDGIFLPLNVYVPDGGGRRPLVVTPPGYGNGAAHPDVQALAGNLALMGAVVAVPEGFNSNGARSAIQENNNYIFYARQLLGLPGSTNVFLQEMVAMVTWLIEAYPVDAANIGATGYSYGGGMSLLLATLDERIKSLSIPATNFGGPCVGRLLNPDLEVEAAYGSGFVWTPPLELPTTDLNAEIAMLYPRYVQATTGSQDVGAPTSTIGPIFEYARRIYAAGGVADRVLHQADDGDHNFGPSRRENTYAWFSRTLFGDSAAPRERPIPLLGETDLEPDIGGTQTLTGELMAKVTSEKAARFLGIQPIGDFAERARQAMASYPAPVPAAPAFGDSAWTLDMGDGLIVSARQYAAGDLAYPVFLFENRSNPDTNRVLYLPKAGTLADLREGPLADLIRTHRFVHAIDYVGLGELKSGRLMLHTFSRYFMYDSPSLPGMVVGMLRAYLGVAPYRYRIYANGWASSFFAACLRYLEPAKVERLMLSGLPENELEYLGSVDKVPDFLLSGRLFEKTSTLELAAASGLVIRTRTDSSRTDRTVLLSDPIPTRPRPAGMGPGLGSPR
jgi:dienelactone hydrolase